jgi:hypothetical protein
VNYDDRDGIMELTVIMSLTDHSVHWKLEQAPVGWNSETAPIKDSSRYF